MPSQTEDLGYALDDIIYGVDDSLGDIDSYTECMAGKGIDYTESGERGWQGLYLFLSDMMPPVPPLPGEEPSGAWTTYLNLENKALDADSECRAGRYAEGLALLKPLLDDFELEHATELTEIQQDWSAILERAEKAGFDPTEYSSTP